MLTTWPVQHRNRSSYFVAVFFFILSLGLKSNLFAEDPHHFKITAPAKAGVGNVLIQIEAINSDGQTTVGNQNLILVVTSRNSGSQEFEIETLDGKVSKDLNFETPGSYILSIKQEGKDRYQGYSAIQVYR
jgi:hypothetical protein